MCRKFTHDCNPLTLSFTLIISGPYHLVSRQSCRATARILWQPAAARRQRAAQSLTDNNLVHSDGGSVLMDESVARVTQFACKIIRFKKENDGSRSSFIFNNCSTCRVLLVWMVYSGRTPCLFMMLEPHRAPDDCISSHIMWRSLFKHCGAR